MTPSVLPVTVHGFTWTASLVAVLNVLVGGALVAWVRSRPKMAEIEQAAEDKLRSDLLIRVEKLERMLEEERGRHEAERALHEAERAADRHKINNVTQCLDALLMLIEQDPSKAAEAAARVKDMRSRQHQAEAAEKATLRAAAIVAASPSTAPVLPQPPARP